MKVKKRSGLSSKLVTLGSVALLSEVVFIAISGYCYKKLASQDYRETVYRKNKNSWMLSMYYSVDEMLTKKNTRALDEQAWGAESGSTTTLDFSSSVLIMSMRAYIGTARDVKFDDSVEVRTISDEVTKQPNSLPPIASDPILVMKYEEAIKRFPQRGKVDHTRIVARKNRAGDSRQRLAADERQARADQASPNRYDSPVDQPEEELPPSMSQAIYMSTYKKLDAKYISAVYNGLTEETISVKYTKLDPKDIKATCVALLANTKVMTLDLTGADGGVTGAVYIADVLRENLYILDLTLAENNIGSEGLATLCDALMENRTLRLLNLSGNKLVESDAECIRDVMVENTTLKSLNLSHNEFRVEGGSLLAEGIEGNDAIEDIDLSWNHLRQQGAVHIVQALMVNSTIRRADLSYNGFHDAAVELGRLLSEDETLTYLDLTSNRFTDKDMPHIVQGLGKNGNLETLLIGHNPFTAPFCYKLLDAAHKNPESKIKELDLDAQSVELDLLELINKVRESRQLYIYHGTVLKADLLKEASDDFDNSDPMMVLMECIAQRQIKLVDLFTKIDKDDSKTITRTELREGLQSLNIPMSGKAVDKLMKRLDIDENGSIDFAEFMEGQREYLQRKKQAEETGTPATVTEESSVLKNKVAKLMKMRKLAKMALVLDSSTEQLKRVIKMNKVNPKTYRGDDFVDSDAQAMERLAKSALTLVPKTPPSPIIKSRQTSRTDNI